MKLPHFIITPFFLSLVMVSGKAYAKPEKKVEIEYYDINGGSDQELKKQMKNSAIHDKNKKTFYAHTAWQVNWDFYTAPLMGGCMIAGVKTTVNIRYRFPRWVDEAEGPPALRERWKHFMEALKEHEEGHADIAMAAANEVEETIKKSPPHPLCGELVKRGNLLGQQILAKHQEIEKDYDRRTQHGKTQGAIFP